MDWNKISLYTDIEGLDALYGALLMEGIECMELQDPRDVEAVMQSEMYWDYIEEDALAEAKRPCVRVYFAGQEQKKQAVQAVVRTLQERGVTIEVETEQIREEDWANNWKQYFKPLPVGDKLMIKPSWEALGDAQGRTVLEIDPSVSFGTGGHATTRLCLEGLERAVSAGCELLDIGCGSGILFVAGMLLGAGRAVAVDIDESAVQTAKENARKNHVQRYEVYSGNVLADAALCDKIGYGRYDVIAANIVADVIILMSGLFAKFLKKGGKLITSGIITERIEEVCDAVEKAGFVMEEVRTDGDWAAIYAVL